MGRSFSFEPFTANSKSVSRRLARQEKQVVSQQDPTAELTGNGGSIHYGHKFQQTEEILQARKMNAQLEELAGIGEEKMSSTSAEKQQSERKKVSSGTPIGALPQTPEKNPSHMFSELIEDGRRYREMLFGSVRDFRTASEHLAKLPLDAMNLVVRRVRLQLKRT